MGLRSHMRLFGRLVSDSQQLGLDALGEPFGAALPLLPAAVATPQAINRLLREHGTPASAGARLSQVELLDIQSISSNCNNVVVRVESEGPALPSTLFIKLPSTNLWTRLF